MSQGNLDLLGVNLAGAEFGSVGQAFGTGYTYPTHAEIDYEAAHGMNIIRLPFLWERLQPTLGGALDPAELARMDDVVNYATSKGLKVDLDLHDYGSHGGQQVGTAAVPNSAFADFWGKLSSHYASNGDVMFGLMNEPQQQSASGWLTSANAAITAIRSAGAAQEVLVPGIGWDGAWTWTTGPNATVLGTGVQDPDNNYSFEVHQYLDSDGSGTHADVVSSTIGSQRLAAITDWAKSAGKRLFLGEFGTSSDSTSLSALSDMLSYMNNNSSVWQGGAYWAAGPWWGGYMYSAEPSNGQDAPQMKVLEQYAHSDAPPQDTTPTEAQTGAMTPAGAAATRIGSGANELTLLVSEDAWQGDAQYTVSVDGQQIGGVLTAHASHASGDQDTLLVDGRWGGGQHAVSVDFLNDAYGGTSAADRNLYVEGPVSGPSAAPPQLSLYSAGSQSFVFSDAGSSQGTTTVVGTGTQRLDLAISEDAYQGDARYTVSVDGQQVGGALTADAAHAAGSQDNLVVQGNWGSGQHEVSVDFLNDLYAGTSATDRNLYVDGASFDGTNVFGSQLSLFSSGVQSFAFEHQ